MTRPETRITSPDTALPAGGRISFLINSMEGGGAERAMANLLGHLQPHLAGYQVDLLLLDDLPRKQTLPGGLAVHTLDGRGKMLRSYAELARHWKHPDHRPDICVSFLARANVLNVWLARRFGHRAIISERVQTSSHIAASRAAPLLAAITRVSYPRADHVIAVSPGVADDLATRFAVPRARMSVIGNAIDGARLMKMADEAPAIDLPEDFLVGLGRLVPNKNFALLLKAYAQVPQAPPLVILGQGPEEEALRRQAGQLGLGDRVQFAGFLENPYPVVQRARALISASRAEGFPNTLIEAMSLGCPVIATDCPSGPADVLASAPVTRPPWPDTAHGILIPMEDDLAMAAAIELICDDTARADYAERAAKRAAFYGVSTVVEAYLALLRHGRNTVFIPEGKRGLS
ncbi:glycosyltransferase [Rhodophyticola sp. CCM32]|uniref:glycosyltransferase n=1 Tax=Rhodophyticola sp. CCM32 TaxID=2916397 RepID=UPI00143D9ACE|nr:glycosyltransferase [Rhodophyticola sp. CCM32]